MVGLGVAQEFPKVIWSHHYALIVPRVSQGMFRHRGKNQLLLILNRGPELCVCVFFFMSAGFLSSVLFSEDLLKMHPLSWGDG